MFALLLQELDLLQYTVGRIIFKDIKFRGYSKFHFKQKFSWKKFGGYGQPAKFLPHVASTCMATRCVNDLRTRR